MSCFRYINISENEIQIRKPIFDFIEKYHNSKGLFILTNGNVTQQKNKISSLNIPFKKEIKVYYSSSMGEEFEKPNPFFLLKILNDNNFCKEQVIYIGDSEIDEKTASAAGVTFVPYREFSIMHI